MKNLFHRHKDLLLIFILGLTPFLWYEFGFKKFIAGVDAGFPFNPTEVIKKAFFTWMEADGFGHDILAYLGFLLPHGQAALLTTISGSVNLGQALWVSFWFMLPMLAMYLALAKIPVFSQKPYLALLAALLYQFNVFQLEGTLGIWQTRFSIYAVLPLVFVWLLDFYEKRQGILRTSILIGLALFFFNGGGSPPLYGSLILLFGITTLFFLIINPSLKNFIRTISFIVLVGIISLAVSFYWTLPYLYLTAKTYQNIITSVGGTTSGIAGIDEISRNASVLNLLRLQGLDVIEATSGLDYIRNLVTNPFLISLSFLWPILAFSWFFFTKNKLEKKYLLLVSLLVLTGVVFTAGSHEPFRGFYLFLLKNIPGFPIFRSPLYKFANLLWFSYTILLTFCLSSIIEKVKTVAQKKTIDTIKSSRILAAVFILFILVLNYPFFTTRYFKYGKDLTMLLEPPSYIYDFEKWLRTEDLKGRILLLPEPNRDWRMDAFTWGYWSGSPVTSTLSNKNFLTNDGTLIWQEKHPVLTLYEALKNQDQTWLKLVDFLDVKYMLLRQDFFYNLQSGKTTSPEVYEKILKTSRDVVKIKSFGQWDFYEIKNPKMSKIYQSTRSIYNNLKEEEVFKIINFLDKTDNYPSSGLAFLPIDKSKIFNHQEPEFIVVPGPIDIRLPVEQGKLVLPKPRFLPGSLFYFLIETKEKEQRQKTTNPKELIDLYLGFSLKRLGEVRELLGAGADLTQINEVIGKYGILLGEIRRTLEFAKNSDSETALNLTLRVREFLKEERNLLASFINEEKDVQIKNSLANTYRTVGDVIKTLKISEEEDLVFDTESGYLDKEVVLLTKNYKWNVPQDGSYEVYISNESVLANSKKLIIMVGGKEILRYRSGLRFASDCHVACAPRNDIKEGWQKIGEVELEEGEHGLEIMADEIPIYSFKRGNVVFYKINNSQQSTVNSQQLTGNREPKLSYTRISPTRYKVEIDKGSKPLTLVFNERFDSDWKIYFIDNSEQLTNNREQRTNTLERFWRILDENVFNTLWQKPLPEENHFKVNGYANGWRIDNKQITNNSQQRYEIIIEYWPQRLLWLGFGISGISVLGSIIYLVVGRKKE